ncbi:MAG: methyltransferase domain-containing protein [Alphaproteobacteria bacterium]|nr:methyltransferase domain-containing protein [Alphaproteobacteria bacterium]
MVHFNIDHIKVNEFYKVYDELVASLAGALIDLGHSCTIHHNGYSENAINILLGSTIFAARHQLLPERLLGKPYILYQLESLDDQYGLLKDWPEYWELLSNASAIWDYSPASTAYLRNKGLSNVFHVPPAFHRTLESFRPRRDLDIDVLFFGSPSDRRSRILQALRDRGLAVTNLYGAFGEARNRYIARAKIVLNIHGWDRLSSLETVRLSFLLANRSFVVSEIADHNPYEDGVVYRAYDELVEACVEHLGMPETRERIAEAGYIAVRKLDLTNVLGAALDRIGEPALGQLIATTGLEPASYYAQSRPGIVALVPDDCRRILDIGCAAGMVGMSLKRRQVCHVTGLDISAEAIGHAAKVLDLAICGDAFDVLPALPDRSYDCVLLLDVLEHVADTTGLLGMAAAKLSSSGILILCVPNVAHWSIVEGLLRGEWNYADEGILDRTHLRFFTLKSVQRAIAEAALNIVDCRATELTNDGPSAATIEMYRQHAAPDRNVDLDMNSFQFILTCRRL